MELLSLVQETNIYNLLKSNIRDLISSDMNKVRDAKKAITNRYGIIYINVMKKNRNGCSIMMKTSKCSYVYDYNYMTEELNLIGGVRKNVSAL